MAEGRERLHKIWRISPGSFYASHGFAASPILCDGGVLVNGHQDGGAFVVLLDGATGREKWRYKPDTQLRSFSTPVLGSIQGNRQIILAGAKQTVGLEPESGEVLAKNRLDEMVQASPAISDGAIYVRGERHVWKIGSETKH